MITPDGFDSMAKTIAKFNGLPYEEALRISCLIGDTPEYDEKGNLVVEGKIIICPGYSL
ncbi:hypothetical protein BH09VER1_BH09VER1_23840 [soil metagenome]